MEAKEVMTGDWVKYGNRFAIIQSITPNECCILVSCSGSDELIWETYDNIEPIPITPEILEKNGWEERPTGYVFYTDGKRYDNSLWYIFGSNTFVVNNAEFQIKYVHQLQHVLRLCGIEKEIIL